MVDIFQPLKVLKKEMLEFTTKTGCKISDSVFEPKSPLFGALWLGQITEVHFRENYLFSTQWNFTTST